MRGDLAEQNFNILTPALIAITAFLSRSSIFSQTGLISNRLNFLCTELYNCLSPTFFLWASEIALIQLVHGQGYILIFLDRMHLLFTQVHFLFWQLGRGQYVTNELDSMMNTCRIVWSLYRQNCRLISAYKYLSGKELINPHYVYIYIYIYIYLFTNLISTSIHGTRKKTLARNKRKKYLESPPRGKRKDFWVKKKENANLVRPLEKNQGIRSQWSKENQKTLHESCNATIT